MPLQRLAASRPSSLRHPDPTPDDGLVRRFHCAPAAALAPFIDRFWGLAQASPPSGRSGTPAALPLPTLLPGTGAELYIHLGTPFASADTDEAMPLGQGLLLSLRHRTLPLAPATGLDFIAVRFRAGMLQRLCPMPAAALIDQACSPQDVWGTAGGALVEQVRDARGTAHRIQILEAFLQARLAHAGHEADLLAEHAVSRLYKQHADLSIEHLADQLGIGRRQLERRVKALTGCSPMALKGLGRFQHTVRRLLLEPGLRPLDAALDQGFHDQAHFIHDFRQRTGCTPAAFLAAARVTTHFYKTSRP